MKKISKKMTALIISAAFLLNLPVSASAQFDANGHHWYYSDDMEFRYWGLTEVDENGQPTDTSIKNSINFNGITPAGIYENGREDYNVSVTLGDEQTQLSAKIGLRGDASSDGIIDIRDAIFIAENIMNTKKFSSEFHEFLSDYNKDKKVNIIDAIEICRYIVKNTNVRPEVNPPLHKYVLEVLELVNNERTAAGLSPLELDNKLCQAASKRAMEISGNGKFSHSRPDGSECFTILDEMNIEWWSAGENIAAGQLTPAEVMESWMNSPGHRSNILDPDFNTIGIGYYEKSNSEYTRYWTQMFIKK